jgi:hypothetical protein
MKILSLLITVFALAGLTSPAFAFGAHNPVHVLTGDACTLTGINSYANNPDCQTLIPSGGKSLVPTGFAPVVCAPWEHSEGPKCVCNW